MTLALSDLRWHYSGGAAKADQNGDQGGPISSVVLADETLQTNPHTKQLLFSNVSHSERVSGRDYHRCLYLQNHHATQTATNVKIYKDSETPAPDDISIGYSGNVVKTQEQLLHTTTVTKYSLAQSGSSASVLSDTRKGQGLYITSADSPLLTAPITKVEFYLQRVGTLTGTATVGVWDKNHNVSTDTPKFTFGTVSASSIPTASFTKTAFENLTGYSLAINDCIMLHYEGGDSSNQIKMARQSNNPITTSEIAAWDGSNWLSISAYDMSGDISSSGGGGDSLVPTGITFSNPLTVDNAIALPNLAPNDWIGVWFKRHVPANCAQAADNAFEYSVVFDSPST